MRKFAGIVESTVAPPTNCLWIKGTDIFYFINGKWVSLLAGEGAEDEVTKMSEFTLGEANYTLPKATKTSLGGVKAITNVANLDEEATTAQIIGVVNTLLEQFRNCGLIQL